MKKFSCFVQGCPWAVFAEGDDELVRRARDHAAERHRNGTKDAESRIRAAIEPVD